ncbi:MAG: helix-turn-helix transcriptional regulator [Lachnospiraceae bacterium]|nr:helix-turn-helix transcriptional regulator [Lachnospiraceae bacterium]
MRTQTYFHTRFESEANKRNETVSLQVNCVGAVSRKEFSNKSVRRDFYYIYVLKGKMIMPDCVLLPGDVMIFEPQHAYQYRSEEDTTYLWVHYTGFDAHSLTKSALPLFNVKHNIGIHKEIVDCFQKLFREFMIHDEAAKQLSVCLLKEILFLTGRYAGATAQKGIPLLAMEYIHSHFRADIDVDALAGMEHMSSTTFRATFRKHTGVSPNEYIISQRISAACQLLSQTDMSISAIAADVGYGDQYYFSRIFKKKVGMPPLKYRHHAGM